MKKTWFVVLAVMLLCAAPLTLSDTVQTKSGETIKGRVVEETKEGVRLKTEKGEVTVKAADVQQHTRSTYVVELRDGTKVEGQIIGETAEGLRVRVGALTKVVPAGAVKNVTERAAEVVAPKPPAVKLTPQQLMALHQRALDLLQKKEYQKALVEYEKALASDPEDMLALYNSACAYSLMKEKDKAVGLLKRSIEAGWVNFVHMEKDTDLDFIRGEEGYKELLRNRVEYMRKSTEKMLARLTKSLGERGVDAKKYRSLYDAERNFVYLHTKTDAELAVVRKSVEEYAEYQWKHLFQNRPTQPLYIVLLTAADSQKVFQGRAGGVFNGASNTLLCGDIPAMALMRTSVVIHEFTHALHFADMQVRGQEHPIWLIEGLSTLFETADRDGEVVPRHSYRLAVVQSAVRQGRDMPWTTMMRLNHMQFMGTAQLAYAQARYMLFYLNERGLLKRFYDEYTAKGNYESDKSAQESVEVVFGKPIESVEREWRQWVLKQRVPPTPFLGIQTQEKDGQLVVTQAVAGSPAGKAGIKAGDVITMMDGAVVKTTSDLMDAIGNKKVGDEIEIEVSRGGKKEVVKAKLEQRTEPGLDAPVPGYLGLVVEQKDGTVCIREMEKDSPAEKAGLKTGAVLLEYNGKKVGTVREFLRALRAGRAGQKVKVKVQEEKEVREVTVELGEMGVR